MNETKGTEETMTSKTYVLLSREVPQLVGYENAVVLESNSLREVRAEAGRLGLRGFVIARRAGRRGCGAFLIAH